MAARRRECALDLAISDQTLEAVESHRQFR
jgi:hypothetical protein